MSHEIVPVPEPGSSAQSKGLQAFLDALPNLTEAELHAEPPGGGAFTLVSGDAQAAANGKFPCWRSGFFS